MNNVEQKLSKTLLILGAGASFDYGFPLGSELIDDILNMQKSGLFSERLRDISNYLPYLLYFIENSIQIDKTFVASLVETNASDFSYFENGKILFCKNRDKSKTDIKIDEITGNLITDNELREHIRRIWKNRIPFDTCKKLITEFYPMLFNANPASIDDFLKSISESSHEYKNTFLRLGKLIITLVLSQYESKNNLTTRDAKMFARYEFHNLEIARRGQKIYQIVNGWYSYLWKEIYTKSNGFNDLPRTLSQIQVITFNYERSLEQYLFQCIKNMYGVSDDDVKSVMTNLKVWHVYGQIGQFFDKKRFDYNDYEPIDLELFEKAIRKADKKPEEIFLYLSSPSIAPEVIAETLVKLKNISSQIRIYHEDENGLDETFTQYNFQKIYFLGFAYHEQNMDKLSEKIFRKTTSNQVWGTIIKQPIIDFDSFNRKLKKYLHLTEGQGISSFHDRNLVIKNKEINSIKQFLDELQPIDLKGD